jgi:ATP/maltotriose-dependent transcriptional regulator MalT
MSVNTVKAPQAIYNKLGVSSRSDAVERARMLRAP